MRLQLTHALVEFGPIGILLIALMDSLGVPLPAAVDLLILGVSVKQPSMAYFAALMAVVGSTIGNVALFHAARHGGRFLLKSGPASERARRFHDWFQRYGLLTVFVPCATPIVPIPLKVFVISAGAMRTGFGRFLLVVVVARSLRYFGEAYLGLSLGEHADEFLHRNIWYLLGGAVALVAAAYLLIRRRESMTLQ